MLESVLNWLVVQVEAWGYAGIFVMMFLESTFFPFPSEVAMIPAGYLAHEGRMSFTLAVLAGLLGSLLGAYFNYYLARRLGIPVLRRYGRYIFFDESRLERCSVIFRRHGEITTFVCRLIPLVRQYISLPAGIAGMNRARFGLYTGLGAGLWVVILTWFGYWVGSVLRGLESNPSWENYHALWVKHETRIFLGLGIPLVLLIAGYMIYQRRKTARAPTADSRLPGNETTARDEELGS